MHISKTEVSLAIVLTLIALVPVAASAAPATARESFAAASKMEAAGDFRGALDAYEKASAGGYAPRPIVLVRIVAMHARLGETEKAFAQLQQMADHGFLFVDMLEHEDALAPLRADPRWKSLVEQTTHNLHPCRYAPEYRQFDFWLGEWDVQIGDQKFAHSSVQSTLDGCVIFENYENRGGYAGKSFSMWDAQTKKWEQRYFDTSGVLTSWSGGLENGRMVLYQSGAKALVRMSYEKMGSDRVRQLIEASSDGGKSWQTQFDGLYVRRE